MTEIIPGAEDIRVTAWGEFRHEKTNSAVREIYPEGMHAAIANHLRMQPGLAACTAALDDPEHGLSESALDETDVLIWWSHLAQDEVESHVVDRVHRHVLHGMGLIVLHSALLSRVFRKLMGTTCDIKWREAGERERIWIIEPGHPIAEGLPEQFVIDREEMYGEPCDIPAPDALVMVSWFQGGEVFRTGCCYQRGQGKIFYFRPGHETFPTYHDPNVLKVITNAVRWAAPTRGARPVFGNVKPLEPLPG